MREARQGHRSLASRLAGASRVRVTGALPAAFLNECARRDLRFQDAAAEDEWDLCVTLRARDVPAAERAAARCGCTLTRLEDWGVQVTARRLKRRLALCAGAFCAALLLFVSSLYIWDIQVTENPTDVPDEEILAVLDQIGVGVGSFWPGLSSESVRTRALLSLPGLSYLTVNVHGSRAEVLVRAAVPPPEIRPEGGAGDVVAARGGVITELRVLEGEGLVQPGDTVTAGDVLVSGRRSSAYAQERQVRARAEATARTWYELTAIAPLETTERVPEGRAGTVFSLICGKRRLNFPFTSGIPAETCDKMSTVYTLSLPGTFTLPVSLVREQRQSVTLRRVSRSGDEVRAALEASLLRELRAALGEGGSVTAAHFSCSVSGGLVTVTLRAECRERIDLEREIE